MADGLLNVVIIAKRNTSLRFLHTLESIKSQVYTPVHIIVVDANEQNSMYSLGLQEDLSSYPEVEYLNLGQTLSTGEMRNYLLDYLEGEYIAFLNDNDTWDMIMALTQIEHMKSEPLAAGACANGVLTDERKSGNPVEPLTEDTVHNPAKWVLYNPVKMSAQIIYRTKAVKEAGGFDTQFSWLCDADMVLRLSRNNKILLSPIFLCECLLTSAQSNYELELYYDFRNLRIKHMDYFLVDKRLTQEFYAMMRRLARKNYMWLDLFLYAVMYFIKGPFRTMGFLLRKLGNMVYYTIRWIVRGLSLMKERLRIRMHTARISGGGKVRLKAAKQRKLSKKRGELELSFVSAKQYNEKNSLAYVFNHRLKKVVIPEHVTVIKKGMFYGCDQLVLVEIPDTVQEIEAHAFQNCMNLRHVIFQDKGRLNRIGEYAFAGCGLLKEMNLPSSVTQVGAYAFAGCYSLIRLMFGNRNLFPTSIQKIPRFTFAGCRSLESVEFEPNSMLETIEEGAFLGCHNLQRIIVTGRLKRLGEYAFAYCNCLESIALLQVDSVRVIGKSAFMYCEALPYFQMPNELERIRSRTFYGCSKLKFIKIPKKVLSINQYAFRKCALLSEALMLSGDIMISPTAFDSHTELKIQESINTDKN